MAIDNAKKLIKKLKNEPEMRKNIKENIDNILEEKELGFTVNELREALIMSRELDDSELDAVTGGSIYAKPEFDDMHGGCISNYYKEECAATVESKSWCGSNDYCFWWEVQYSYQE